MHAPVDELAPTLGIKINQWYSIFITIYAQNQITKESWIDSFNKVNLHSQARVSFNDLIIKLDVWEFFSAKKLFEKGTNLCHEMSVILKKR